MGQSLSASRFTELERDCPGGAEGKDSGAGLHEPAPPDVRMAREITRLRGCARYPRGRFARANRFLRRLLLASCGRPSRDLRRSG